MLKVKVRYADIPFDPRIDDYFARRQIFPFNVRHRDRDTKEEQSIRGGKSL